MFNVARKEWKWIKDNPVSDVSFTVGDSNARDRWLSIEEGQRLLECATALKRLRPLLTVALNTGMRKGEILNLKWQDIDFGRRILTVQKSKNGLKRGVPMNETLTETLRTLKSQTKVFEISGWVFPISDRSLRAAFDKTKKKAEITDFHFHDLRHTSVNMTKRYANHYPESLRASVRVLDSCHDSCQDLVTVN